MINHSSWSGRRCGNGDVWITKGGVAIAAPKQYNRVVATRRRSPQEFLMDRITVAEAAREIHAFVDRIFSEGLPSSWSATSMSSLVSARYVRSRL